MRPVRAACLYVLLDPRTDEVRYVGWTSKHPRERLRRHVSDARAGKKNYRYHWLRSLLAESQRPIMRVVAWVECAAAPAAEQRLIAALRARGTRLVNGTDGGEGMLGYVPNQETRAKLSAAGKGRKLAPRTSEHRARLSEAARRRVFTFATRSKMAAAHRGKHPTPETRAKMAAWQKGRVPSPTTRAAAVAANRGRPLTLEHRANLSAAMKGHPITPETRAKMAASRKGSVHTPETRAKLSAAKRAWWERRRAGRAA